MIADPDQQIRRKGFERIIDARNKMDQNSISKVRTFVKPSNMINDVW